MLSPRDAKAAFEESSTDKILVGTYVRKEKDVLSAEDIKQSKDRINALRNIFPYYGGFQSEVLEPLDGGCKEKKGGPKEGNYSKKLPAEDDQEEKEKCEGGSDSESYVEESDRGIVQGRVASYEPPYKTRGVRTAVGGSNLNYSAKSSVNTAMPRGTTIVCNRVYQPASTNNPNRKLWPLKDRFQNSVSNLTYEGLDFVASDLDLGSQMVGPREAIDNRRIEAVDNKDLVKLKSGSSSKLSDGSRSPTSTSPSSTSRDNLIYHIKSEIDNLSHASKPAKGEPSNVIFGNKDILKLLSNKHLASLNIRVERRGPQNLRKDGVAPENKWRDSFRVSRPNLKTSFRSSKRRRRAKYKDNALQLGCEEKGTSDSTLKENGSSSESERELKEKCLQEEKHYLDPVESKDARTTGTTTTGEYVKKKFPEYAKVNKRKGPISTGVSASDVPPRSLSTSPIERAPVVKKICSSGVRLKKDSEPSVMANPVKKLDSFRGSRVTRRNSFLYNTRGNSSLKEGVEYEESFVKTQATRLRRRSSRSNKKSEYRVSVMIRPSTVANLANKFNTIILQNQTTGNQVPIKQQVIPDVEVGEVSLIGTTKTPTKYYSSPRASFKRKYRHKASRVARETKEKDLLATTPKELRPGDKVDNNQGGRENQIYYAEHPGTKRRSLNNSLSELNMQDLFDDADYNKTDEEKVCEKLKTALSSGKFKGETDDSEDDLCSRPSEFTNEEESPLSNEAKIGGLESSETVGRQNPDASADTSVDQTELCLRGSCHSPFEESGPVESPFSAEDDPTEKEVCDEHSKEQTGDSPSMSKDQTPENTGGPLSDESSRDPEAVITKDSNHPLLKDWSLDRREFGETISSEKISEINEAINTFLFVDNLLYAKADTVHLLCTDPEDDGEEEEKESEEKQTEPSASSANAVSEVKSAHVIMEEGSEESSLVLIETETKTADIEEESSEVCEEAQAQHHHASLIGETPSDARRKKTKGEASIYTSLKAVVRNKVGKSKEKNAESPRSGPKNHSRKQSPPREREKWYKRNKSKERKTEKPIFQDQGGDPELKGKQREDSRKEKSTGGSRLYEKWGFKRIIDKGEDRGKDPKGGRGKGEDSSAKGSGGVSVDPSTLYEMVSPHCLHDDSLPSSSPEGEELYGKVKFVSKFRSRDKQMAKERETSSTDGAKSGEDELQCPSSDIDEEEASESTASLEQPLDLQKLKPNEKEGIYAPHSSIAVKVIPQPPKTPIPSPPKSFKKFFLRQKCSSGLKTGSSTTPRKEEGSEGGAENIYENIYSPDVQTLQKNRQKLEEEGIKPIASFLWSESTIWSAQDNKMTEAHKMAAVTPKLVPNDKKMAAKRKGSRGVVNEWKNQRKKEKDIYGESSRWSSTPLTKDKAGGDNKRGSFPVLTPSSEQIEDEEDYPSSVRYDPINSSDSLQFLGASPSDPSTFKYEEGSHTPEGEHHNYTEIQNNLGGDPHLLTYDDLGVPGSGTVSYDEIAGTSSSCSGYDDIQPPSAHDCYDALKAPPSTGGYDPVNPLQYDDCVEVVRVRLGGLVEEDLGDSTSYLYDDIAVYNASQISHSYEPVCPPGGSEALYPVSMATEAGSKKSVALEGGGGDEGRRSSEAVYDSDGSDNSPHEVFSYKLTQIGGGEPLGARVAPGAGRPLDVTKEARGTHHKAGTPPQNTKTRPPPKRPNGRKEKRGRYEEGRDAKKGTAFPPSKMDELEGDSWEDISDSDEDLENVVTLTTRLPLFRKEGGRLPKKSARHKAPPKKSWTQGVRDVAAAHNSRFHAHVLSSGLARVNPHAHGRAHITPAKSQPPHWRGASAPVVACSWKQKPRGSLDGALHWTPPSLEVSPPPCPPRPLKLPPSLSLSSSFSSSASSHSSRSSSSFSSSSSSSSTSPLHSLRSARSPLSLPPQEDTKEEEPDEQGPDSDCDEESPGHYEAIYEVISPADDAEHKAGQTPADAESDPKEEVKDDLKYELKDEYAQCLQEDHDLDDSFDSDGSDEAYTRVRPQFTDRAVLSLEGLRPLSIDSAAALKTNKYLRRKYNRSTSLQPPPHGINKLAEAANLGMKRLRRNWSLTKNEMRTGLNRIKKKSTFSMSDMKSTEDIVSELGATTSDKGKWSLKSHFRRKSSSTLPAAWGAPLDEEMMGPTPPPAKGTKDNATFYLTLTIASEGQHETPNEEGADGAGGAGPQAGPAARDEQRRKLSLTPSVSSTASSVGDANPTKGRPLSTQGVTLYRNSSTGSNSGLVFRPTNPPPAPPSGVASLPGPDEDPTPDTSKDRLAMRLNQILSAGPVAPPGRRVLRTSDSSQDISPVHLLPPQEDKKSSHGHAPPLKGAASLRQLFPPPDAGGVLGPPRNRASLASSEGYIRPSDIATSPPPLPARPPSSSSYPPFRRGGPVSPETISPSVGRGPLLPRSPSKASSLDSDSKSYLELSYEAQGVPPTDDPPYVSSHFADEPLYQFYTAKVERAALYQGDSSEDDYEVISDGGASLASPLTSGPRPTAMELVTPSDGRRTLWCELSEVVASGILKNITSQERKLQEAMFEVITSEASYLKSLEVLVTHFMNCPEFTREDDAVVSRREMNVLFSDILPVKKCSEFFLGDLEKRWQESVYISGITDVVLKHATSSFNVYVKYCSNQIYQDRKLRDLKDNNPRFVEVLYRLEMAPICQSLAMQSFLMLPMQRVTRLPLLIDAIFNRLEYGSSQWHECKMALASLQKIVAECNEAARKMERMEEMLLISHQLDFREVRAIPLISASRWLVKRGELTRLTWREGDNKLTFGRKISKHSLYLFLFTDLLVVTKKRSDDQHMVLDHCPRNMVQVLELESADKFPGRILDGHKNLIIMTMLQNHENKTVEMVLSCPLESDRTRWMEAVTPRISDNPDEKIYEEWDCPQVQAIHSYVGQQPDELSLEISDVFNVLKKTSDGWYQGERLRDGARGWFPGNHTSEIASAHVRARNLRQRYRLLAVSGSIVDGLKKEKERFEKEEKKKDRRKTITIKEVL